MKEKRWLKRILIGMPLVAILLGFMLQIGSITVLAETSLPNPSLPNPSLPNPSLPNPSLPNPSLPSPSLPNPSLSNPSISDSNIGNSQGGDGQATNMDGENKGLGEWLSAVGQFLSDSWEWIKDNWEVTVTTVVGVALVVAGCFFPPLLVPGISLLVGEGLSGLAGYFFSGLTGEELTQEMAIGGILGLVSGGLGGVLAKGISLGVTKFVIGNGLAGAITSVLDDTLHNRKLDIGKMVIGAVLAGGLGALAAGYMGNNTGLLNSITNSEKVSKPSVSSQKVDVPEEAGKGSGTVVGEGSSSITVSEQSLKHSTIGDFTLNPKTGAVSRMKGGGHGQSNINFLEEHGIEYNIEKIYPNGVKIGNIPLHKTPSKRVGTNQAWFPESWTDTDIQKAGEYVANLPENIGLDNGVTVYGNYNGVRVGVIKTDGKIGTIFPDAAQQP